MTLEQILSDLRERCGREHIAYVIIAGEKRLIDGKLVTSIASNSSRKGVRGVISASMVLDLEGHALLAKAVEDIVRANVGVTPEQIDGAARSGAFSEAAKAIVGSLQPHWTLTGWDKPDEDETPTVAPRLT